MKIYYSRDEFADAFRVVERPSAYHCEDSHFTEKTESYATDSITHRAKTILMEGIHIAFINKDLREDIGYFVRTEVPYLQMHFELRGSAYYTARETSSVDCSIPQGHHTLFYFPALYGQLVYPKVADGFSVEIEITEHYLRRILHENLDILGSFANDMTYERPTMLGGRSSPITPKMSKILLELFHCPYAGDLKLLFFEGKLLELLCLQIEDLRELEGTPKAGQRRDYDAIIEITELIKQRIDAPYAIEELAHLIGINRTKLQRLFKEIHGTTIYRYIADLRMDRAVTLLSGNPDIKIAEVAREIGYKNANHFSTAYKRRFGMLPRITKARNKK